MGIIKNKKRQAKKDAARKRRIMVEDNKNRASRLKQAAESKSPKINQPKKKALKVHRPFKLSKTDPLKGKGSGSGSITKTKTGVRASANKALNSALNTSGKKKLASARKKGITSPTLGYSKGGSIQHN